MPARILIVDDHPNTASMLARALRQFSQPVEILTARSGPEALELIGQNSVEVLITDFMMPGMNGLELIERLQNGHEPAQIILVTAYDSPGLAATARRLKVNHYLIKPVQPDKIREIVSQALESRQAPKAEAPVALPEPSQFKILIADDQPDNVQLLATRLQSEGYTFVVAGDGQETLDQTRRELPDLILLDVNMPKKSGFEVLAEMRADPQLAHIPVIILTAARTSVRDVREGLGLGADDYVTKPFDWRELAARVRSKLRVKHAEDLLRRRNRELSLLPQIGQELSARLDVNELAGVVLKRAVETLSAASGHLVIFNLDDQLYTTTFAPRAIANWDWDRSQNWLITKGLIAEVVNTREALLLGDTEGEARWYKSGGPVRAAVCVPLLGRRGVIGALTLAHDQPGRFTADHLALLQAIASQAAIAIENAQLYAVEHKRVKELVALNTLTHDLGQFTRSSEVFERVPQLIASTLGYPAVSVWWMHDSQLLLRSQAGGESAPRLSIMALGPQQVAATGQPAYLSGGVEERTGARAGTGPLPTHSAVAVPMRADGRVVGVLAIHSRQPNVFQESDRVLLQTLAAQIMTTLERLRLFESVDQERNRLNAVLRSAADAILVLDAAGRLQLINPAGTRLFTDVETKLGQPLPVGCGYDELLTALRQAAEAPGEPAGLTAHPIAWPDKRVFNVAVAPVEHGGQVAILHDVTAFKDLERVKNEFLATASHDLKNPLTAVIGYGDLLERVGPLTPQQGAFLGRIKSAARQMHELVQDLLDLARMDLGVQLSLERSDLGHLVAEVADEFRPQAAAKGQTLRLAGASAEVQADRARLRQVFRNLIGNAIKYTPEGGLIEVMLSVRATQACVQVRDTGLGIPATDLPYIFDKFYRVQADDRQGIEGSGLGLAIVKAIVDQHAGDVTVESTVGQGTCFTVSLPVPVPLAEPLLH
ncbi:MAG: response regulator [Anaerolineales bacterium]|nr:response regulator [Anaerolineales bacterium]